MRPIAITGKVAAHATTAEAVRIAVEAGVDTIEHAYEVSDDSLKTMAEKGIVLVPTDGPLDSYLLDTLRPELRQSTETRMSAFVKSNQDRLRRAIKAGVKIAAGSDVYYQRANQTRGETSRRMFRAYADAGMLVIDILRAATVNAAQALGIEQSFGGIEPGLYANIIAVCQNPLHDVSALNDVRFVMKIGRVFRNKSSACPQ